jgi:hypothetical protein
MIETAADIVLYRLVRYNGHNSLREALLQMINDLTFRLHGVMPCCQCEREAKLTEGVLTRELGDGTTVIIDSVPMYRCAAGHETMELNTSCAIEESLQEMVDDLRPGSTLRVKIMVAVLEREGTHLPYRIPVMMRIEDGVYVASNYALRVSAQGDTEDGTLANFLAALTAFTDEFGRTLPEKGLGLAVPNHS